MTDPWNTDDADSTDWTDLDDEVSEYVTPDVDAHFTQDTAPRVVAELPGGQGSLVLSGPGAGTAVLPRTTDTGTGSPQTVTGIATRDQALRGTRPLMIVHCPHQNRGSIPRLLASVLAATSGAVSVGASVRLPAGSSTAHNDWLDSCAAASVRLADPLCYLLDPTIVRVPEVSALAKRRSPYLAGGPLNIGDVLDAQRNAGANLLLTSGRALDPTSAQKSLDVAFEEADDALAALGPGERLALNLTLPAQWLSNRSLRNVLFAQLVDQEQFDLWHIRVQWPATLRALHQPLDYDLLDGYKRLSQLASDEERVLLLPQSGLTGWLQLGFGAAGFGAGPFGSGHAFKEDSQGGGGGNPPIPRYFEPTLLHPVERNVHDVLSARPGYVTCDCPYCPALLSGGDWDHELARLHHLHWMGRLAGIGAATGRSQAAAVRRTVRDAIGAAADQPLVGISVPQHLSVWDRLL